MLSNLLAISEILHIESFAEAAFDSGDVVLIVSSNNEIDNIKSDVCPFIVGVLVSTVW